MRAHPSIDLTFYETYSFAHVVKSVLEDQVEYLRRLNDFYGDGQIAYYVAPFRRFTVFHAFIEHVLADLISDDTTGVDLDDRKAYIERFKDLPEALDPHPARLPIELAMERFQVKHESFESWLSTSRAGKVFHDADHGDVEEYCDELRLGGEFGELLGKAAREVFFVLFQNRRVLLLFNDMMADAMRDETGSADARSAPHFARPGVLKRVAIPEWARRAVYYRDRGRCVLCDCDLSGLVSLWSEDNFDHMVPLAAGGLNDCTNLQLLCSTCNTKKSDGAPLTSSRYEAWFDDRVDEWE